MTLTNLKKNWFFLTLCSDVAIIWFTLKFINNLPDFIISSEKKREISSLICCVMFKFVFYLNPQIKIKALNNWEHLNASNGPLIFLINHTSPLDSFLFAAMCPIKYSYKIRTLAKADLFQMPILGDLMKYCGHFPVHFLRSDVGSFSVDKEKQAKVIGDVKNHLTNGGYLGFFPEGQLNRFDTRRLQSFRVGLFKMFSELDISDRFPASPTANHSKSISMYAFLHTGLEKTWHPKAKMGGASAHVQYKVFPLLFSSASQVDDIQNSMQKVLDTFPPARATYSKL